MTDRKNDLDAMIDHEKRLVALEYQDEAWAGGISDGIDREIMAEAAAETAMRAMIEAVGEEAALTFAENLRERVLSGDFTPHTLQ